MKLSRKATIPSVAVLFAVACAAAAWLAITPGVTRISHAGGGVPEPYSNAREAFDKAYGRGFRYFETDFEWTTDGRLVLIHDWEEQLQRWFPGKKGRQSHAAFVASRMRGGLTPMDDEALFAWMRAHPDARVVTDVKTDNLRALALLAAQPDLRDRFIPQIYEPEELAAAKGLGFSDIILTVYRTTTTPDEINAFVQKADLYALTVPVGRVSLYRAPRLFVHTVNNPLRVVVLMLQGVDGIYTDTLSACCVWHDVTQLH